MSPSPQDLPTVCRWLDRHITVERMSNPIPVFENGSLGRFPQPDRRQALSVAEARIVCTSLLASRLTAARRDSRMLELRRPTSVRKTADENEVLVFSPGRCFAIGDDSVGSVLRSSCFAALPLIFTCFH